MEDFKGNLEGCLLASEYPVSKHGKFRICKGRPFEPKNGAYQDLNLVNWPLTDKVKRWIFTVGEMTPNFDVVRRTTVTNRFLAS